MGTSHNSSPIIHGYKAWFIRMGIRLTILKLAIRVFINPVIAIGVVRQLMSKKQRMHGNSTNPRYIKSGSSYYWGVDFPGWPSKVFSTYVRNEFARMRPAGSVKKSLQTVIFAITNRCPLHCRHCSEGDNLGTTDKLSLDELKQILVKLQDRGILHIQLSGGEPLVRFDDMIELMKCAKPGTNFWLLTSGFGLSVEKAALLKKSGLTGVNISLDHWDEKHHNEFRNNDRSFQWVKEAVENCRKKNLIVSVSLCATKQFISEDNLWKYVELAKSWKVEFIRILEPRNAGRYAGSDAELELLHQNILEKFYLKLNSGKSYRNYPILLYPGYHQRKAGCFGAGNRYFYIDSNADIHACPFCLQKCGNALTNDIDNALLKMNEAKCHAYEMNCTD